MNLAHSICQDEVIRLCQQLPSFPLIISKILSAVNDTDANLNELVSYIEQDPVIAARVLSLANRAGSRTRNLSEIMDLYTAISLIGVGNILPTRSLSGGLVRGSPTSGGHRGCRASRVRRRSRRYRCLDHSILGPAR